MSNILSDIHRQTIAKSIVETVKPKTYAECGCYRGASMGYWAQILPEDCIITGCDKNGDDVKECRGHVSRAVLVESDSRDWLQTADLPEPIVFYLDTDWTTNIVKDQELAIIFERWQQFVIVANSVNYDDHPLYGSEYKPWSVEQIWELVGAKSSQFIVPRYKHPILQNGYAVISRGVPAIPFDENFFSCLKQC